MNLENLLFPFDYIILIIFLLIILTCVWKGFIQSVLSLLTWFGSVLVTIYSYSSFSNFIIKQLLNIQFFQNYEYFTNIIGIIIAIPIIFLLSLFLLKRIRKFLSADLDKQILGIILDKFFGLIYGAIFSYIIMSAILILLQKFELENINNWLIVNSYIVMQIENFNNEYIFLINNIEDV